MKASRLDSLDRTARLLRGRANRHAWFGLSLSLAAIVIATLLASGYSYGDYSLHSLIATQSENPALWLLDCMPLLFLVWGQYIGTVMSYQAGAMVLDETRELRDEASRLQHELRRAPSGARITDELGLPSRQALLDHLRVAVGSGDAQCALLVLSTDQYQDLLLSQGDSVAAVCLRQLRDRLHAALDDSSMLAHLGHDHFAALLALPADEDAALHAAERIQKALDLPLQVGRSAISLRASIGIALYPQHASDMETLLRHAESATYAALGENRSCLVYSATMDQRRGERARLRAELYGALHHDGLGGDYRLQCALQPGLPPRLRLAPYWDHPKRGRLEEADFIELPNHLSLTHGLSLWLLREGLNRIAQWRQTSHHAALGLVLRLPDAAAVQLDLAEIILRLIRSHDLPASALTLEWPESALIAADEAHRLNLAALREAGVHLAVSGVGAPGTSAQCALYFPVDEAQLSPRLLGKALQETAAAHALHGLIRELRERGQCVVFSGVDDARTQQLIAQTDGQYAEGAAIRHPMSPAAVERWLRQPAV